MNKGDYLLFSLLSMIVVLWFYIGYRFLLMVMSFLINPLYIQFLRFPALFFSVLFFLLIVAILEEVC